MADNPRAVEFKLKYDIISQHHCEWRRRLNHLLTNKIGGTGDGGAGVGDSSARTRLRAMTATYSSCLNV